MKVIFLCVLFLIFLAISSPIIFMWIEEMETKRKWKSDKGDLK